MGRQVFRVWAVELYYSANKTWEPWELTRDYREACDRMRALRADNARMDLDVRGRFRIREYVRRKP